MNRWSYFLLAIPGLVAALAMSVFQLSPGYMDADYYFAGGLRLAQGYGYTEQILWNYLDDPAGLPHPSHGYWMPLTSILAALSMALTGGMHFANARAGFWLLAAFIPPLSARLCLALGGKRRDAWLAGLLAGLSGFYLPYLPVTDAFGLYMVLGAVFFLLIGRLAGTKKPHFLPAFLLGLVCGLMHLTRADGFLWIGVALFIAWFRDAPSGHSGESVGGSPLYRSSWMLLGYLLCMGPWMARNLAVFGAPLAPGGARSLWITNYDELYTYPANLLTANHWLQSGLGAILQARGWATGLNLQTALAVQGEIFLTPLILAGLWRLRRQTEARAAALAWLLTFLVMTVIFPFQGARGGFFHSGAALQPLFWAVVPYGLAAFVQLGSRWRGWNLRQAELFFALGLASLALLVTALVIFYRMGGAGASASAWGAAQTRYTHVEQALQDWGASADAIVLVNNAPGYWVANRRPSISIPYGDRRILLEVARRYHAQYLLLEMEQVNSESLYAQPGDRPGLRYAGTVEGIQVYEIQPP